MKLIELFLISAGDFLKWVGLIHFIICLALLEGTASGQCKITESHLAVKCYGHSTGSIDISVENGTAPYVYSWSNGSTTEDLTGIPAGVYTLTLTDAKGCNDIKTITLTQPAGPLAITAQPVPQTDCYGNHAEFNVLVNGNAGTINYQWQMMAPHETYVNIGGMNTSLLPVDNIGANGMNTDGTLYRVIVSDECNTLTSDPAVLHINTITDLLPKIVNSTICYGGSFEYQVVVSGNVLSYQWSKKNGSVWEVLDEGGSYAGVTSEKLNIVNATLLQSGAYRVSVVFSTLNQPPSEPTCVETSFTRERNLLVRAEMKTSVLSGNQQICTNNTPNLLIAGSPTGGSGPPYTLQWQSSADGLAWTDIPGATSLTYQPSSLISTTLFRIVITDGGVPACGKYYSAPVKVEVYEFPLSNPIMFD